MNVQTPMKETNTSSKPQRSSEPVWWALFSAGGVCFAVFIPAAILFFGLLQPIGLIEFSYSQAHNWFFSFWGLMFSGAFIILPSFHAAHRIRHGLHDLKVQHHGLIKVICYGVASLIGVLTLGIWLTGVIA
ncbi:MULTISPECIES: fumarate reductase subunit FrdD [Alteromonadaceae]|uniref:fumarate reductase subunit FrdD n=1 Tax=Alteromonadaceae TaxID=72275 RepID=UPI002090E931|nr:MULTISPECIES: fumarate reductase subunit FrdD [Aliiglaciecola]MDO6710093.1 fumarate reductase subunit FrdD [Aliiglaciecola sp. 2_MG-2023]MDO6751241.1 fumarate reductase subunit FrdD [Aliiglaciecola sp. 1_MG-2023]